MIDPCEDCLINTVCSERCDQRREYTQDVYAELRGQELLYRKNIIIDPYPGPYIGRAYYHVSTDGGNSWNEKYKRAEDLFNEVQRENFTIKLRGGIDVGDGSSSSSTSSSSSRIQGYVSPSKKRRIKK